MEIRTIFVKNTYVFTASMYVLVLLLMACHIPDMKQHETSPSAHAHISRYETHETK